MTSNPTSFTPPKPLPGVAVPQGSPGAAPTTQGHQASGHPTSTEGFGGQRGDAGSGERPRRLCTERGSPLQVSPIHKEILYVLVCTRDSPSLREPHPERNTGTHMPTSETGLDCVTGGKHTRVAMNLLLPPELFLVAGEGCSQPWAPTRSFGLAVPREQGRVSV